MVNVALSAVEVAKNRVIPLPELKPLPAPPTIAPLFIKVPFAAVALPSNAVVPPCAPLTVAALFINTPLAAVEVSLKFVRP